MNHFTCPSCGARYLIVPEGEEKMKRGFFRRKKREFEASQSWQASIAQPAMAPQALARPPAQHDSVMTRDVQLPLAQARITGFYFAWGPTIIAAIIVALAKAGGWWWAAVPATFGISFLLFSGAAWYILLQKHRKILWFNEIERFLGIDLNRDGFIGKPPKPDIVRVERTDRESRSMRWDDLPISTESLREVAHAVLQLRCNVSKRGLAKDTSLSVEKAAELLTAMREAGFARFNTAKKPESGTALTKDGLDLLEQIL